MQTNCFIEIPMKRRILIFWNTTFKSCVLYSEIPFSVFVLISNQVKKIRLTFPLVISVTPFQTEMKV